MIKNKNIEFSLIPYTKYLKGHNGFIAGGCFKNIFNNETPKDLDIFFQNETEFSKVKNVFMEKENYDFCYKTDKVFAIKDNDNRIILELNKFLFGTPEQILNAFDFTITKFALTKENDDFVMIYCEDFYNHLFFKRLVVDNKILYPVLTFERIIKYSKQNYYPCRETKVKLLTKLKEVVDIDQKLSNSMYDGID